MLSAVFSLNFQPNWDVLSMIDCNIYTYVFWNLAGSVESLPW